MKIANSIPMELARYMVAVVVLLSLLQFSTAAEAEMEEALVGGETTQKKEAFTNKECLTVVDKVQKSKLYTEESIVPICNDVMRSGSCDFFAEALSLASSHSDFKPESFCADMDRAQFCSEIMDGLLKSTAVSDLAFGECDRAKNRPKDIAKDDSYCRKIKKMLAYSVENQDLDTMRACYMMEAYTNLTSSSKELEASQESPKQRIIAGGNKELEGAGKGKGPGHPPPTTTPSNIGKPDIVLQPVPLENFGKTHERGNLTATPPPTIVTDPQAAGPAPAAAAGGASPAPAPVKSILAKPIPAAQLQQKSTRQVSASTAGVSAATAVALAIARHGSSPVAAVTEKRPVPPQVKATPIGNANPVILQATVMMPDGKGTAHPMLIAQPLKAQAIMINGTLVMTGAPFGTVVVDQHGIDAQLKKQAAAAVAKPTTKAPAVKSAPVKMAAQPAKAKAGLLTAVQPKVVTQSKATAPVVVPAQPAAPSQTVVPARIVLQAAPVQPVQGAAVQVAKAQLTVPVQQVVAQPVVQPVQLAQPVQTAQPVQPVASAAQPVQLAQPVAPARAAAPEHTVAQVAPKAPVAPPAKPQVVAKTSPAAVPVVQVVAVPMTLPAPQAVAPPAKPQVALVAAKAPVAAVPAVQVISVPVAAAAPVAVAPPSKPQVAVVAAKTSVAAVPAVQVIAVPVAAAAPVAAKAVVAPPARPATVTAPVAKVAPPQPAAQAPVVAKAQPAAPPAAQAPVKAAVAAKQPKSKQVVQSTVTGNTKPVAVQKAAAASAKKTVLVHAAMRVVKAHAKTAAAVKGKVGKTKEKSDYSGFLSKFVGVF